MTPTDSPGQERKREGRGDCVEASPLYIPHLPTAGGPRWPNHGTEGLLLSENGVGYGQILWHGASDTQGEASRALADLLSPRRVRFARRSFTAKSR